MSHYKPYPAYKDSGVEWLGRVPEHWECARFDAKTTTHRDSIEADRLNGVRVLHYSIPAVQAFGCAQEEEGSEIDSNKLVVSQRQLLVSKLNPHKQTLVVADSSDSLLAIASTEFVPLIPVSADLGYITYVWSSAYCQHYLLARCESSTRSHQRVAPSDITRMSWVWPGLEEQAAIVRALDRETGRIDALIEKKARFIELLREKRQALITHAATKGLNPNVKMKDSGVEWLGKVPEHWTVSRLGHFASVENGSTPSRENPDFWENGTVPWLGSGEVNQVQVTEATELITELALQTCSLRLLPKETVVVGMVGQGKTRGLAAILKIDAAINQNLAAICSGPRLKPMFMLFFFGAAYTWIRESGRGSNQAALNCELLSEIRLALPPMNEQEEIVRHLVTNGERMDALIEKTERSIEFLKERRSALITAAVTGQIDLRESA
ncbi:TPA: restriction endonuclease subunit S [Pseudomonas aeruginosa]|uniref:restriction endonuclease subunit S n=1 Tax=Pseudomonas aeruginosa TaxID=287 RepID=UPI002358D5D5|nr:restriction endonuclease subunit S [Pseudomonas aeruginosa]MEE4320261.1 restriction endonuclease subunit S [Pseudomonas aeruginosa]